MWAAKMFVRHLKNQGIIVDGEAQSRDSHVADKNRFNPDGKNELKHAIAERATDALKPLKVTDVLFSDFVVQF